MDREKQITDPPAISRPTRQRGLEAGVKYGEMAGGWAGRERAGELH